MSQTVVPHDAVRKYFRRRDRPQKNMLAVLDRGMCEWHANRMCFYNATRKDSRGSGGYYLADEPEAGDCRVSCSAPGYEMPQEYPVTLVAGDLVILDFSLVPVSQQN